MPYDEIQRAVIEGKPRQMCIRDRVSTLPHPKPQFMICLCVS